MSLTKTHPIGLIVLAAIVFPALFVRAQSIITDPVVADPATTTEPTLDVPPEELVLSTTAEEVVSQPEEQTAPDTGSIEQVVVEAQSASSSDEIATTTPPVEEPIEWVEPEPTFVLQPAVDLTIRDNDVSAKVTLENLTCKRCDKVLPELEVIAYYTGWYPNDGEIGDIGPRFKQEASNVADVPLWGKENLLWTATDVPKGRYYFVVVVDPNNEHGAYRMHRSEFAIQ